MNISIDQSKSKQSILKLASSREVELLRLGHGRLPILLLGAVHGNESEGFLWIERLTSEIEGGSITLPESVTLWCVPRINPDGAAVLRRTNQRNVDLNRNLPTMDWSSDFTDVRYFPGEKPGSEMESIATLALIESLDPAAIVSLHSYADAMINYNGECEDFARFVAERCHLPAKGDIGYPTPGSLGTWAGWERNIPTLTVEFLRGQEPESVWQQHTTALLEGFAWYADHPLPKRRTP